MKLDNTIRPENPRPGEQNLSKREGRPAAQGTGDTEREESFKLSLAMSPSTWTGGPENLTGEKDWGEE